MEELIIKYLKEGKTQAEIATLLSTTGSLPSSLSSVEKKLKKLRVQHNAKTMFHLGLILARKELRQATTIKAKL